MYLLLLIPHKVTEKVKVSQFLLFFSFWNSSKMGRLDCPTMGEFTHLPTFPLNLVGGWEGREGREGRGGRKKWRNVRMYIQRSGAAWVVLQVYIYSTFLLSCVDIQCTLNQYLEVHVYIQYVHAYNIYNIFMYSLPCSAQKWSTIQLRMCLVQHIFDLLL